MRRATRWRRDRPETQTARPKPAMCHGFCDPRATSCEPPYPAPNLRPLALAFARAAAPRLVARQAVVSEARGQERSAGLVQPCVRARLLVANGRSSAAQSAVQFRAGILV